MYCKTCGKAIPDDSKFCPFCGENLADVAPMITREYDDTKRHIDSHRHTQSIFEVAKQEPQKPVKNGYIIATRITMWLSVLCALISVSIVFVANGITSSNIPAFKFKIAWYIIFAILLLVNGIANVTLHFVGKDSMFASNKLLKKQYAGIKIFYLILTFVTAVILFICVACFVKDPKGSDSADICLIAPCVLSFISIIFSTGMVIMNSMILYSYKKPKKLSK